VNRQLLKESIGWGILLWFIGYILGIVLFMLVPPAILGWVIMPFGVVITLYVLYKKIKSNSSCYYLWLAIAWTLIAILFDYFFLMKVFKPADGYYKLDVYVYYLLTFTMPMIVGLVKAKRVGK